MENNKYQRGKVYKITDNTNDNIYIGSTCEPSLARRLAKHVACYKCYTKGGNTGYMSSFKILENDDYDIVLIELFPCDSKDELYARERYWTNLFECVNHNKNQGKMLQLGKVEYKKEYNKEYREDNKDKIKETDKKYREDNKDKIKEYRELNKDKIKEYYQLNKDNINKVCECECGLKYTQGHKSRHQKTNKHKELLEAKEI